MKHTKEPPRRQAPKTNKLMVWFDPVGTLDHFGVGFGNGYPHRRPIGQLERYSMLLERMALTGNYKFRPFCGTMPGLPVFGIVAERKGK